MKTTSRNICQILAILVVVFECVATTPAWYTASDGNQYFIEGERKYNWLQANDECARRGLQLVIIDNAAKNAPFDALLRTIFERSPDLWLGHHDEFNPNKDTGRPFYALTTGQMISFNNWKPNEPNNVGNNEHCTHVYEDSDYKWNDIPCHSRMAGYICEQHYLAANSIPDINERRQTANILNAKLLSDYRNRNTEIEHILESTRSNTDEVLVKLNDTTDEIIGKSKISIAQIVREKPYLGVVIADVGESIEKIIRETLIEIVGVSSEARQTIENIHLNAEGSISEISSDFEDKLETNSNNIDKLFE